MYIIAYIYYIILVLNRYIIYKYYIHRYIIYIYDLTTFKHQL